MERHWASRNGASIAQMRSVERARKAATEYWEVVEGDGGGDGEERGLRVVEMYERTEAMVKNRRGAAEVDVRRDEGVAEVVEVEESERMDVVGSS